MKNLSSVITKVGEIEITVPSYDEIKNYILKNMVIKNNFAKFLLNGIFRPIGMLFLNKNGKARTTAVQKFTELSLPEGIKPGDKIKVVLCEYKSIELGFNTSNARNYVEQEGGILPGTFGLVSTLISNEEFLSKKTVTVGYDKKERYAAGFLSKITSMYTGGKLEEVESGCIWNVFPSFIYFKRA